MQVGTQIIGSYQRNGQTEPINTSNQVNSGTTNTTVSAPGASSFNWSLVSTNAPNLLWGATAPSNSIMYVTLSSGQSAMFDVSATTSCGFRTRRITHYIPSGFRVAPNPAKESFAVEFDHADVLEVLPEEIELLSETSTKPVRAVKVKDVFDKNQFKDGKKIQFDVRDLPRGTYYLWVTDKRNKEKPTETVRIILE